MEFEDIVGYTLRIGVILSITLLVIGMILLYYTGFSSGDDFKNIISPNSTINSKNFKISQISINAVTILYFGIIILISTPIIRVIVGIIQFYKERNITYFIITLIVLLNIMISIFFLNINML